MLAIRRIRRMHILQYLVLGGLMLTLVLLTDHRLQTTNTRQNTALVVVLLLVLLVLVMGGIYLVFRRMRPNLRRPEAENLRIYQSVVLLRNSFLALVSLPPLLLYHLTSEWVNLLFFGVLLVALCVLTLPTERKFRRWLLT
ncbi:hypothetical protein F1C16_04415 [Hymenobacter sp. NBH84]|uniref:hypothetical protein n=1 Tax=Hymenobacter sp. NBH84 TaxID=2596915 RepID=UPI001626C8FD|nr:hypothetical protein [Hymenobacter sp. NBH84]QNE38850.1 hypothetical protein F1C16_04415 [Hymenobacter sp. NBH84]